MKNRTVWLAAMTFGLMLAEIAQCPRVWAEDNASNPIDNLSLADLKKIFLSDRSRWDTGKAVAPVIQVAGTPERVAFLKIVCHMSDADFSKYFVQAAFTGKDVTPPKEVASSREVRSAVASSPGAIGFRSRPGLSRRRQRWRIKNGQGGRSGRQRRRLQTEDVMTPQSGVLPR